MITLLGPRSAESRPSSFFVFFTESGTTVPAYSEIYVLKVANSLMLKVDPKFKSFKQVTLNVLVI